MSACHEMSKFIEPPIFYQRNKEFRDLGLVRWSQLTTWDKNKQALLVVHMLCVMVTPLESKHQSQP